LTARRKSVERRAALIVRSDALYNKRNRRRKIISRITPNRQRSLRKAIE
jgi:hypothetical protein